MEELFMCVCAHRVTSPSFFLHSLADHWANRKLLQSMLERQGYKSEWVENGQEAVDAAATRQFDLILMVNIPCCQALSLTVPPTQTHTVYIVCLCRFVFILSQIGQSGYGKVSKR